MQCRIGALFWPMNEIRVLTPTLKNNTNHSEAVALNMKFHEMHQTLATI